MRRRRFLAGSVLLLAAGAVAADEYPHVVPGYLLQFPKDAGAHPAFRSEWWYITGWVQDARGSNFGIQVTFFRNRPRVAETNAGAFAPRQSVFAHAAFADVRHGKPRPGQRAARTGSGLAEAREDRACAWVAGVSRARPFRIGALGGRRSSRSQRSNEVLRAE